MLRRVPGSVRVDLVLRNPMSPTTQVDIAARTDRGKVRENNEDAYLVFRSGRFLERIESSIPESELTTRRDVGGYVMAVADGMGGASAGEVASREALKQALRLILRSPRWLLSLDDLETRDSEIRAFFDRTKAYFAGMHGELVRLGSTDPSIAGMGTTVTVAYSLGLDLFVVHVGDSRVYVHHKENLHRVTRDHTLAQTLADVGAIKQEEVESHPERHVLTQVVGGRGGWIRAETHHVRLRSGDSVLLCSDGLTGPVSEGEIAQILTSAPSAAAACDSLIGLALDHGAPDNVTVIVARYSGE
jgi:serine/threonine protein phosphatase PrpC